MTVERADDQPRDKTLTVLAVLRHPSRLRRFIRAARVRTWTYPPKNAGRK